MVRQYMKKSSKNILKKKILKKILMKKILTRHLMDNKCSYIPFLLMKTSRHQEENIISDNPFEDIDDTLFHDFGSEEVLEEPLDETNLSGKRHMKHSELRIKPCVMKRRWRSMPMKRKKNLDEVKHDEASSSFLLLDEDEVIQTCLPPSHEDEETIILNDTYDLVQDFSNMVNVQIDDFIQVGRCRWDVICFSINRYPIYDIGGGSQEEVVEFSSSEEFSS
jgi:hypothetical protein